MYGIIENLWNGNIAPAEHCGTGNPDITELVMLMERHKKTLHQELNKSQLETLEKYLDCIDEYVCLLSMHAFKDGFCLSGKLMAEIMAKT